MQVDGTTVVATTVVAEGDTECQHRTQSTQET